MATWEQFAEESPELAGAVHARFTAAKHHVLATLRRDGSPRVSGTEVAFRGRDVTLGSMLNAVKAKDLQRDPRFALHANPGDGSMEGGDAKMAGRAILVVYEEASPDGEEPHNPALWHLFRLDLNEVVLTGIHPDGDRLVIRTWLPGQPLRVVERR